MRKGLAVAVAAFISVFALKIMVAPNKMPAATTSSVSPYDLQIAHPKLGNLPIERAALP